MLDPNAHVSIRQYGVLTGDLEKSISGEIVVDGEILTLTPYDSNWDTPGWPLNKQIEVTITDGLLSPEVQALQEDYSFYFVTKLHPMYSSYILVRQTGGAFLDRVSIDTINREIHYVSLLVDAIASEALLSSSAWFITKFVTCRVAYSLLTGVIQGVAIDGYRSKTLGDFTIEANTNIQAAFKPKLDELINCILETSQLILNEGLRHAPAAWGVRAEHDLLANLPYMTRWPLSSDRLIPESLTLGVEYPLDTNRRKILF